MGTESLQNLRNVQQELANRQDLKIIILRKLLIDFCSLFGAEQRMHVL